MSVYINVGARLKGRRIGTKKALREALDLTPEEVSFDCTDAFGERAGAAYTVDSIPEGAVLTVTGPDPYTSRKWYASVSIVKEAVKIS